MASAMYPDDQKASSAYEVHSETNSGVPYQQQGSTPLYPPIVGSRQPPPPVTAYTQPIASNTLIGTPFMDNNATRTQCPRCHQQVITVVTYSPGVGTLLIGLTICLFGGFLGCCLIPLCISGCQDAMHSCPACGSVIGRHNLV